LEFWLYLLAIMVPCVVGITVLLVATGRRKQRQQRGFEVITKPDAGKDQEARKE
jgi:hypothetical protein